MNKPKLTFNSSIKEIYEDEKFVEMANDEIKKIKENISGISGHKKVRGGVVPFFEKFTIEEMKYQFLKIKQRKSYLTNIQKMLINQIISNAIIRTVNFYLLESVTPNEIENTVTT